MLVLPGSVLAHVDHLLDHVQPARLERDPHDGLVRALLQRRGHQPLDELDQPGVDGHLGGVGRGAALRGERLLGALDVQAAVLVDPLGEQRLHKVRALIDIEERPGAQRILQGILELPEVKVDLGGDKGGQLALGKRLVLVQALDVRQGLSNLRPEVRHDCVELRECVRLDLRLLLLKHGEQAHRAG